MIADSQRDAACNEFQQRLPELIQAGAKLYDDPHLQVCDLCRRLVVDLEQIADAARRLFKRHN